MAVLSETNIITEFEEFDVPLNCGSPLLDKCKEQKIMLDGLYLESLYSDRDRKPAQIRC